MKTAITCLPLIVLFALSACGQSTSPLGTPAKDSAEYVPISSPAPRVKNATPTPDPPVSGEKNPTQGPRKQSVVAPNARLGTSCADGKAVAVKVKFGNGGIPAGTSVHRCGTPAALLL